MVFLHFNWARHWFDRMCREHTASVRVRAPSTNVSDSTQHILTADAGPAAESQVWKPYMLHMRIVCGHSLCIISVTDDFCNISRNKLITVLYWHRRTSDKIHSGLLFHHSYFNLITGCGIKKQPPKKNSISWKPCNSNYWNLHHVILRNTTIFSENFFHIIHMKQKLQLSELKKDNFATGRSLFPW